MYATSLPSNPHYRSGGMREPFITASFTGTELRQLLQSIVDIGLKPKAKKYRKTTSILTEMILLLDQSYLVHILGMTFDLSQWNWR